MKVSSVKFGGGRDTFIPRDARVEGLDVGRKQDRVLREVFEPFEVVDERPRVDERSRDEVKEWGSEVGEKLVQALQDSSHCCDNGPSGEGPSIFPLLLVNFWEEVDGGHLEGLLLQVRLFRRRDEASFVEGVGNGGLAISEGDVRCFSLLLAEFPVGLGVAELAKAFLPVLLASPDHRFSSLVCFEGVAAPVAAQLSPGPLGLSADVSLSWDGWGTRQFLAALLPDRVEVDVVGRHPF